MFGRPTAANGDAVAAAQRRLDALAATFSTGSRAETDSAGNRSVSREEALAEGDDETDASELTGLGAGVRQEARATPGRGGRHRARKGAAMEYGRWDITTHHVTLAAVTVAALVAVTAWWILRAEPETVSVTSERALPTTLSPSDVFPAQVPLRETAATTGKPTSDASVIVDVAGKVRRPGIVELPAGARVADALDSAGGVRPGVDIAALNLARLLVDGEQIVVGLEVPILEPSPESLGTIAGTPTPLRVDLNSATAEQLETLPGIGPVTAAAILAWRAENGAFTAVDELLEVSGIGDATLAEVEAYVYV
ncbi:MAG: ComEA family DNA-binding protein [Nocardioidaceae bacterium]|nr:ComEA family DNA-binding protein [Nocardioidaceae bacterium]